MTLKNKSLKLRLIQAKQVIMQLCNNRAAILLRKNMRSKFTLANKHLCDKLANLI